MPELHIPLNQNLTTGQWYTMNALIEDDLLKVWVNGLYYGFGDISPVATPIPSSGFIGLWANNAHVHFDDVIVDNLQPEPPIPEPSSLMLLSLGLGTLGFFRFRKRN